MKYIYILLASFILFSCKSRIPVKIESGKFQYRYENYDERIDEVILNSDGTFTLNFYGQLSFVRSYSGEWKYIDTDTILITCPDEHWTEAIQRGYISVRQRKLKVMSNDKLKMPIEANIKRKYVILKRVE